MTEGGFNPLRIAAEHASGIGVKATYTDEEEKAIKKKMAYFDDLMRARKLDAKFAVAALKLTTSQGGRHAGAVIEQSKTPIGLATQIMESMSLVSIEAVKLFDAELRAMLTTVLETITRFIQWMKVNKDTVAAIALLAAKVTAAFIAFHVLSWVIASTTWLFRSLWALLAIGYTVVYTIVGAVWALTTAFTAEGAAATAAWFATLSPIALISAGILVAIANLAAFALMIASLGNKNGFTGVLNNVYAFGQFILGFFYNISANLPRLFEFIAVNWRIAIFDMMVTFQKAFQQMAVIAYDLFVVRMPKMVASLTPGGMIAGMVMGGGKGAAAGGKVGDGKGGYDTSMLKLNAPNLLGFMDGVAMPDNQLKIPEKPDINFDDFITEGKPKKNKAKHEKPVAHALNRSNDHAQRMYEYSQSMMGSTGAVTKDNAPMKQVSLLEQIARNTQPDTSRGDEIDDVDF
jgi:hypothetical protein